MDNDKQVSRELGSDKTISRFLSRPILPDERDRDSFDLEHEFAKTAKNRSPLIPIVIVAFLVLLALGAWVASQFTEQASQKSTVSIGTFEDLKLKELFDTARKNKKDLETVQNQIDALTQEANAKIQELSQAGAARAEVATVRDPSGAQARAINAATAQQVAAQRAALQKALAPLLAQRDEAQKKIDSYDNRIGELNKKNQQVLDTQQRLFDLEKKKLVDQYESRLQAQADDASATVVRLKQERESLVSALKTKHAEEIRQLILKYNPVIATDPWASWIASDGATAAGVPDLPVPERIASASLVPEDLQKTFATQVDQTQQLLARLRAIPSENSVPGLVNALDHAIARSLQGYNGYLAPLATALANLDSEVAQRDALIAQKDADLAAAQASLADLTQQLATLKSDRETDQAAAAATLASQQAWTARWTGAVDEYVASLREDGVFVDAKLDNALVVLKADRAKALDAALAAPTTTTPAVPINLATVRDGLNNAELGTVTVERTEDGRWTAKLVKQNDAKKPFKAFDRLVLSLPAAKK